MNEVRVPNKVAVGVGVQDMVGARNRRGGTAIRGLGDGERKKGYK